MPGATRVGQDSAVGVINGPGVPSVLVNGKPVSVPGDAVASHSCCGRPGCGKHCSSKTSACSGTVKAGGKGVVRAGDATTCGHVCTGSADVIVG